jgi:hypothetical protein
MQSKRLSLEIKYSIVHGGNMGKDFGIDARKIVFCSLDNMRGDFENEN